MRFLKNPAVLAGIVAAAGVILLSALGWIHPPKVIRHVALAVFLVGLMAAVFSGFSRNEWRVKIGRVVMMFCAAYIATDIAACPAYVVYLVSLSPEAQAERRTHVAEQEAVRKSRTLLGRAEEGRNLVFTVKDVPELVGNVPNGRLYAFRGIHPDLTERLVFLDTSELSSGCRMPGPGDKVEVVTRRFRANNWWQAPVDVQLPLNYIFLAQPKCQ